MTVIYNMSIDRADKPWIGDRRFTESRSPDGRGQSCHPAWAWEVVAWLLHAGTCQSATVGKGGATYLVAHCDAFAWPMDSSAVMAVAAATCGAAAVASACAGMRNPQPRVMTCTTVTRGVVPALPCARSSPSPVQPRGLEAGDSSIASRSRRRTVVALVPMKHTSLRVPGKNYRTLKDKPLCCWVLSTLQSCKHIDTIVVDTDSQVVRDLLAVEFPAVHCIERPQHLLDDPPMNEILMYDTSQVPADFYIQTHVTNPFLRAETIDAAIERFLEQFPIQCDSLFSVRQWQTRLVVNSTPSPPLNNERREGLPV